MCTSTDSSNLALARPLTSATASCGAYSRSRSTFARSSAWRREWWVVMSVLRRAEHRPGMDAQGKPGKDAGSEVCSAHERLRTPIRRRPARSCLHLHAHRAGSAGDDARGVLEVVRVEVGELA